MLPVPFWLLRSVLLLRYRPQGYGMRIRVGQRQDKYPVLQWHVKVRLLRQDGQKLSPELGQLSHRPVHILPVRM